MQLSPNSLQLWLSIRRHAKCTANVRKAVEMKISEVRTQPNRVSNGTSFPSRTRHQCRSQGKCSSRKRASRSAPCCQQVPLLLQSARLHRSPSQNLWLRKCRKNCSVSNQSVPQKECFGFETLGRGLRPVSVFETTCRGALSVQGISG